MLGLKKISGIFPIILICVLLITQYKFEARYYNRIAPPENCSFENLPSNINLDRIAEIKLNNGIYYLANNKTQPWYVFSSGPAIYVFDSEGKLVEWIKDSGDQPEAMSRWDIKPYKYHKLDELLERIQRKHQDALKIE